MLQNLLNHLENKKVKKIEEEKKFDLVFETEEEWFIKTTISNEEKYGDGEIEFYVDETNFDKIIMINDNTFQVFVKDNNSFIIEFKG